MENRQLIDTPWLEILPPPAPEDLSFWLILLTVFIVIVLSALAWRYWQLRPKQRALRRLKQLQQQLKLQQIGDKQCLFEINRQLCIGLQQPQLVRFNPPGNEKQWQGFYNDLSSQQYRADNPDRATTLRLLLAATQLLKELPV